LYQLRSADVLAFVLGKGEKKNGTIGPKSDQHAKAASFALPWSRNPLLDEAATEVRINQPPRRPLDGIDQTEITDAVLSVNFARHDTGQAAEKKR
jgi:hypothetical protein